LVIIGGQLLIGGLLMIIDPMTLMTQLTQLLDPLIGDPLLFDPVIID